MEGNRENWIAVLQNGRYIVKVIVTSRPLKSG